jgi:hypothetical protein
LDFDKRSTAQNKLFYDAAKRVEQGSQEPEPVRVYEKIKQGIWTYNGTFHLTNAWIAKRGQRKVFKFRLVLAEETAGEASGLKLKSFEVCEKDLRCLGWKASESLI